jgi:hypothetical protein
MTRPDDQIEDHIKAMCIAIFNNVFDDGLPSESSSHLMNLLAQYGHRVLRCLADLIASRRIDTEIASDVLQLLGEMDHPPSRIARLALLRNSLRDSSYWIRDGATLGLALLDDPVSIPYLKRAIEQEYIAELREDMEQVLAQLEETGSCHL